MSARDRVYWDTIYRDAGARAKPYPDPDPLLFMYTPPMTATGSSHDVLALDLACGLGQNGLWLASQGYVVDLVDISRVALMRAQEQAHARGLRNVNFLQTDLDQAKLEPLTYDLVCVFRYLRRDLFPQIRASIKPGGRIIYETFNTNYLELEPTFERDYLLEEGELASYFADWQVLRHTDNGFISQVVAIKPEG